MSNKNPFFRYLIALSRKIIFVSFLSLPGTSTAATIEAYSDPIMGCTMLLTGMIEEGDADRLEQFISTFEADGVSFRGGPQRLCLNSPGGSFSEGVRLARVIMGTWNLGTALSRGHRCVSACAVAFMAGGATGPEGAWRIRPILHPQARLGFHAPSIDRIQSGQYSEQQIIQAWNVALETVAEIVALRSLYDGGLTRGYNFHERLFFNMLSTPAASMYYIDTVAKATEYDISVYPVGINSNEPVAAFYNLCAATMLRQDGVVMADPSSIPEIRSLLAGQVEAFFDAGFGVEASSPCSVSLDFNRLRERDEIVAGGELILSGEPPITVFGQENSAYAYMSFDPSMRLDQLPTDIDGSWQSFINQLRIETQHMPLSFGSCWLTTPLSRVTNVTDYVNLRRQPDFSSPVVRQVPRGEQVRPTRFDNVTITGAQRLYDLCVSACQSFGRNPQDRQAAEQVQQCIDDNLLWYEITDARGNRGWVSRRFLEEW